MAGRRNHVRRCRKRWKQQSLFLQREVFGQGRTARPSFVVGCIRRRPHLQCVARRLRSSPHLLHHAHPVDTWFSVHLIWSLEIFVCTTVGHRSTCFLQSRDLFLSTFRFRTKTVSAYRASFPHSIRRHVKARQVRRPMARVNYVAQDRLDFSLVSRRTWPHAGIVVLRGLLRYLRTFLKWS